ncbi:MAG: hypothetical protein RLZ77_1069, partial [Bacteroidota bacterium]
MIRNYNCLSSRLDSWLKNGIGDASTSPPQQKSSRTTWLGAILLLLFTVFGANLQAQVTINETFDGATTPTGWTYASFARSTAAPCTGTASIRKNQWSSATTASAAAPLFTSNAQPLNISFSYKLVNYAATVTATTPALTNTVAWGSVITEVSIDGGTTYSITAGTINSTNHVVSQSCATQSYTVPGSSLPSGSSVRVRFRLTFAGTTPDYFVYMDNVSIVQVAPACSGTPVAGTSSPALQNICPGSTPAALSLTGATTGVTGLTYQWEQSTDGGSNYINVSTGTGATSASYTPAIFGGSTVLYRCKVTCSNSTEFAYSTAATVAPPATPATQVSNALVSAISTTGFTTSWTNGNGNRRLVLLSTAPITDPVDGSAVAYTANTVYAGGQQVVFDGTGTSVAVTGLSLGTTYYIKVYEYIRCGAGPFDYYYNSTNGTNSITAATCGAATIPYNESFETAVVPNFAACTVTSSHPLTRSTTATGAAPRTGTKYQNIRWTPTVAKYVYSAPLAFNGSTSYDMGAWYLTDGAAGWTTIKLFVNTAPTAVGATLLTTVSAANNTTYQKLMGTYVAPATGNYYSIIEVVHTSGPNDMSIDDLFAEATPTCTTPSALVVSSQNLSSATVSWTASTTTPANGYEYFYSTTNTAPTAGTTPSGAVAAGVTTATITGLAVDTNYFWWVRANCDGVDKSAWVAGSTIRLGYCIPVTSFGCTDGDVIARVTLNTLDNNSGTGCPSGLLGYSNYTADPALTTTLQAGSSYNCIVYAGQYSEGYAAWIDYNDDGNFDNATERIGFSNGQVAGSGVVGQLGSSASFP